MSRRKATPSHDLPRAYTVGDVALILQVSEREVYRLKNAPDGPKFFSAAVGDKTPRIWHDDLMAWSRTRQGDDQAA